MVWVYCGVIPLLSREMGSRKVRIDAGVVLLVAIDVQTGQKVIPAHPYSGLNATAA